MCLVEEVVSVVMRVAGSVAKELKRIDAAGSDATESLSCHVDRGRSAATALFP